MDDGRRERRDAGRLSALRRGLISWRRAREAAPRALARHGQRPRPRRRGWRRCRRPSGRSSRSAARWPSKSDILVLDEPTAALPEADVERLLATLGGCGASGIGIIYVTHRLDEVFRIADRVTVLRDGRRVATVGDRRDHAGRAGRDDRRPRSMSDAFVRPAPPADRSRAGGRGPRRRRRRAGLASRSRPARRWASSACAAPGITPIGRAIFGAAPASTPGAVRLGRPPHRRRPIPARRDARRASASSRAGGPRRASPRNLAVRENIYMNPAATGKGVLEIVSRAARARRSRARRVRRFSIKADGSRAADRHAVAAATSRRSWSPAGWRRRSACWSSRSRPSASTSAPRPRSTTCCSSRLKKGMAVLLISSDFEEVERICHRALVFGRGRVVAEIRPTAS